MDKSKDETWRLRYLRILTGPASEAGDAQEDLQAIEDLVDEKLMRGSTFPNEQGEVRAAALITGKDGLVVPTLKGRLFIEDQRAFLRSRTAIGRLRANFPLFSGILGVVVGWLLSFLTPLIWPHPEPTSVINVAQPASDQSKAVPTIAPVPGNPPTP